jgi:hypothetical protein
LKRSKDYAMRATEFEFCHQALIHLGLVGIAFATYVFDPDDIVWALMRNQAHPRLLERLLFAVGTVLIGVGAMLRTWARAHSESDSPKLAPRFRLTNYPELFGSLLFTVGLAFLAPLWGSILLIVGESILVFRLIQREKLNRSTDRQSELNDSEKSSALVCRADAPTWGTALRREAGKWGLFFTMVVFTLLLRDRIAEVLGLASLIILLVLNCTARMSATN